MQNNNPIIDLRHKLDWRRRLLSELCTLCLWATAIFLVFGAQAHTPKMPAHSPAHHAAWNHGGVAAREVVLQVTRAGAALRHGDSAALSAFPARIVMHQARASGPALSLHIDASALLFAGSLLGAGLFLVLWKLWTAATRPRLGGHAHWQDALKVCATTLHLARHSQVCTVHHDETGQIVSISHRAAEKIERALAPDDLAA